MSLTEYYPADETELAAIVTECAAQDRKLDIHGGGTKRGLARPVAAEARIRTDRLAGVRLYEAEELVLTAGAGTAIATIRDLLAQRGQHLAFDPPDYGQLLGTSGEQTLGGVVACNVAGPRRLSAGALRDSLLGFRAVNGSGEIFKSGGRVVKNVTGYDLSKLIAGSWGTLAIVTEATIKVLPRPETSLTLLVGGHDAAAATGIMAEALGSPHEVSSAAWLGEPAAARLGITAQRGVTAMRVEGFGPSVTWRVDALKQSFAHRGEIGVLDDQACGQFWAGIRDVTPFAAERESLIWRISCPPRAASAFLGGLNGVEHEAFLDWGGGLIWLRLPPQPDAGASLVRSALAQADAGGHATLFRAPEASRRSIPVFQPLPAGLETLTRRVKAAFDPAGILEPGRMYEGV